MQKIKEILDKHKISSQHEIAVKGISRKMDFAIPNKDSPKLLMEVSYQTTTSSGMGDKAKTELNVKNEIRQHYRDCLFVGFIDGAGWLFREQDLDLLVGAFDHTFTFHSDSLDQFEKLLKSEILEKHD